MNQSVLHDRVWTFPSRLGWMAILGCGKTLKGLAFGYSSAERALGALGARRASVAERFPWNEALVDRLQAYASGAEDSFLDVEVDLGNATAFHRGVIHACRRIPWGSTLSYGELAAKAGRPGAARAVGHYMAANRVPLVVPCHRVLGADGRLHGYSGPGGLATKRRLLKLEGAFV
jgi:methylated-DNA-[protein]-cysteine S-methyltransferase